MNFWSRFYLSKFQIFVECYKEIILFLKYETKVQETR